MDKFLGTTAAGFILFLSLFVNDLKAVKFTEANEAIFIESENKYPSKIFDAEEFLDFLDDENQSAKLESKPIIELDLSNDSSLNSSDIKKILTYFKKRNIKVNYLNISNTNIDEDVLAALDYLLTNASFKQLDISGTGIAQCSEDFPRKQKVIFIDKSTLETSRGSLEDVFGKDVIGRHISYYETTKSFTKIWNKEKFEGLNLRRVTTIMPDKDNELTSEMAEDFLNSQHSLINLRTLSFEKQNIDDSFIKALCNNKTFSRIMNLDLTGNPGVTDSSLDLISGSNIIGSIRDLPQTSGRYNLPSSEIYITVKGTGISFDSIRKYKEAPQNNDFSITYLHPFYNTPTADPVTGAIKWLQFR
ncbi:MAG: hypothetical protein JNJ47_04720 [Alphaproteobacteria bacterium]|nr:hypothetical protein [Alphaproteobacteria bacterium]